MRLAETEGLLERCPHALSVEGLRAREQRQIGEVLTREFGRFRGSV